MLININMLERMSSNIIGRLRYNYQCINRVRLLPGVSIYVWATRQVSYKNQELLPIMSTLFCVPNVASVSGLPILDIPFGFLLRLFVLLIVVITTNMVRHQMHVIRYYKRLFPRSFACINPNQRIISDYKI